MSCQPVQRVQEAAESTVHALELLLLEASVFVGPAEW